ncbi:uncharacterized protein BXZ73DRAFT_100543 [Epithele typhae]|uniref:uncharacterized protein n=1 Tax=Epithele typhae TaxID=378194 RepID=UPI0020077B3E|nr:uncharacterized protein BXZ73DRAFT_100543 [Epithele typhae]KAH9935156.1 hypothetical protein BXZ73DRAFT_100543 [Epithele typhae]
MRNGVEFIVLLFYDVAITFQLEVQRIWRRRHSGATWIFLFMRYSAVIERVFFILEVMVWYSTDAACGGINHTDDTLTILNYLSIAAFTALRIYAIWLRDWRPLVVVIPLSLVRPVEYLYISTMNTALQGGPLIGCINMRSPVVSNLVLAKAATIACDVILIVFTWIKTFSLLRDSKRTNMRDTIAKPLLRDGTAYFLIILAVQVITIAAEYAATSTSIWVVWPYFEQALTVIFFSRFMLDLRGVYYAPQGEGANTFPALGGNCNSSTFSDLHFATRPSADNETHGARSFSARVVGNMGATLSTTLWDGSSARSEPHLRTPMSAGPRDDLEAAAKAGLWEIEEVEREEWRVREEDGDERVTYAVHPFQVGLGADSVPHGAEGRTRALGFELAEVRVGRARFEEPISPQSPESSNMGSSAV